VKVEVSKPATTAVTVTQSQVPSGREPHQKREILRRLLRGAKDLNNAIIFCNRKREVAVLHKSLQKHGFSVGALHGDMDQSARTAALDQFRKGELPLLVASDVAARGLDIPAVSHVFNFDVPHHPDDYVHRIGRTGRAGRTGTAISIVTPLDTKSIAAIEKLIGQSIPRAEGDFSVQSDASETDEQPREARRRDGSRERTGRNSRREREPRHGHSRDGRNSNSQPQAAAPRVPSIGRPEPRHTPRDVDSEPADHSHLPAFLLRPVRARV
jgi:superfamily II DNA/RNA helicase